MGAVVVHSALPPPLAAAADAVLTGERILHVAHGDADPVAAAVAAAEDGRAVALLGPFRSHHVAEALEATAPAGLLLLAPVATWAGVTRSDEPGCDEPADHGGLVRRLVARDTEVARRIAVDVRARGLRAFVVAGSHEYGEQLNSQLRLANLPRVGTSAEADLIVLCGLEDSPELEDVRALTPLPVIAFDGIRWGELGADRHVLFALPFAPIPHIAFDHLVYGAERARHGAQLVADAVHAGADRGSLPGVLRDGFDEHGDPLEPSVWLWRLDASGALRPDRGI